MLKDPKKTMNVSKLYGSVLFYTQNLWFLNEADIIIKQSSFVLPIWAPVLSISY